MGAQENYEYKIKTNRAAPEKPFTDLLVPMISLCRIRVKQNCRYLTFFD